MGHNILLTPSFCGASFGCGKQSLASLGVASMSSGRSYRPDDPDQQDRADEAGNQVADPSSQDDAEVAENGAGNCRSDDAERNIHNHSHVTLHELLCQPACNPPDDDGCYPAHSSVTHGSPPRKGTRCASAGCTQ